MNSLMWKSVVGGFAACCAMSPFLSPVGADDDEQIQPEWRWESPRHRDTRDRNSRDNDDWDDNDGWNRNRDRERISLDGVVTRTFLADRFEIRSDDGLIYRVIPDAGQERFIARVGDRVRVRGAIDGSTFLAQRIQLERDIGDGDWRGDDRDRDWRGDDRDRDWRDEDRRDINGRREVNFPATVESRESALRLTVRGDNGRLYLLQSRTNLPRSITIGSRVRVQGSAVGNQVRLERIVTLDETRRSDQFVNFRAVVERVEDFNRLRVRADNGRIYSVRVQGVMNVREGDRVRVRGNYARGLITVANIERI